MAKALLYLLLGAFLFAFAAAGAWFFLKSPSASEEAAAEQTAAADENTVSPTATGQDPETPGELPVPLRASGMSAEDIFRFSAIFRSEQQAHKKRQAALEQQEVRLNTVREDLRAEQHALSGMLVQIRDSLEAAEKLLAKITEQRLQLAQERQDAQQELDNFKQAQTDYKHGELDNVKQISRWFQTMPPENAADYLRQLSDDGNMSSAVQLLANLEEREAAAILVAMDDPALVVQLTERFKGLKRPEKKTRR